MSVLRQSFRAENLVSDELRVIKWAVGHAGLTYSGS